MEVHDFLGREVVLVGELDEQLIIIQLRRNLLAEERAAECAGEGERAVCEELAEVRQLPPHRNRGQRAHAVDSEKGPAAVPVYFRQLHLPTRQQIQIPDLNAAGKNVDH